MTCPSIPRIIITGLQAGGAVGCFAVSGTDLFAGVADGGVFLSPSTRIICGAEVQFQFDAAQVDDRI